MSGYGMRMGWKRVDEAMEEEWRMAEKRYTAQGLSRHQAHQRIAAEYGYSTRAVFNHCRAGQLEKDRERARAHGPPHRLPGYWRDYRRERGERLRQYRRHYRDVFRGLDLYVRDLFNDGEVFTLSEVAYGLRKATGIQFRAVTIRNRLTRYASTDGRYPVLEAPDGGLRLNRAYYECRGLRNGSYGARSPYR